VVFEDMATLRRFVDDVLPAVADRTAI